jgi:ABC-type uncharacterized transport system permease subunit
MNTLRTQAEVLLGYTMVAITILVEQQLVDVDRSLRNKRRRKAKIEGPGSTRCR